MKYHSSAQRAAVMSKEKEPGLYHGAAPNGFGPRSPLKDAAMQHIKQPRSGQPSGGLIPAVPQPPSTPTY